MFSRIVCSLSGCAGSDASVRTPVNAWLKTSVQIELERVLKAEGLTVGVGPAAAPLLDDRCNGSPLVAVCSEKVSPHEFLGFGGRGRQGKRFVGVEFKVVEGGVGDGL